MLGAEPTYLYRISVIDGSPVEHYLVMANNDAEAFKILKELGIEIKVPRCTKVFGYRDVIKVTGTVEIVSSKK